MFRKVSLLMILMPVFWATGKSAESPGVVEEIAQNLSQELPAEGRFLVTDFQNELGKITELGRSVSTRLRVQIANDPQKKVVEGSSLRQLIKNKLDKMGYIHNSMKWQPGSPSSSEIEIHGTFTEFPRQLELRVRLLDSQTGDLKNNLAYRFEKTKDVYSMHTRVYDSHQNKTPKGDVPKFAKAYISALFLLKEDRKVSFLSEDPLSNVYHLLSTTKEKHRNFNMAISLLHPYLNHKDKVIQSSVESFIDSMQKLKVANAEFTPLLDQLYSQSMEINAADQTKLLRRVREMEVLSEEFWEVALKSTDLMAHSLVTIGSKGRQVLKMTSKERSRLIKEIDLMFPEIQERPYDTQKTPIQCAAAIRNILVGFRPERRSVTELMLKRKYFAIGSKEYLRGNYAAAITGWKICLLIDPTHEISKRKIKKAQQALRRQQKNDFKWDGSFILVSPE